QEWSATSSTGGGRLARKLVAYQTVKWRCSAVKRLLGPMSEPSGHPLGCQIRRKLAQPGVW
ncbi:MAG: hypothetical protein JSW37_11380, partial [Anaerolineales bacterium]